MLLTWAVVTPRVSLGQNNSPFPPCCCISKVTEFSQNTWEPARVWTKQPHLLKFCLPPSLDLLHPPCPLDDEWGAAVSPIKPSGMPTTGRDCNELFCQQRGSECHTPSIRCLMAFGARLQDSILRPVDTQLLFSFAFL